MPKVIGTEDVERLVRQDVPLVDVLPEESYRAQHIPGAVNAPVDAEDFDARIRAVAPDPKAPVVVYCRDPPCEASPAAAHIMEDHLGYEDVRLYEGGLLHWRRSGRDFAGAGPRRVHLKDLQKRT